MIPRDDPANVQRAEDGQAPAVASTGLKVPAPEVIVADSPPSGG